MLLTYAPRVFRFALRGKWAHQRARKSKKIIDRAAQLTPTGGLSALDLALYEDCYSRPLLVKTYCGYRMMDLFGHVNNAKYLEMMEYARWYYLSYTSLAENMRKEGVYFVVSNVTLQFVREIQPGQSVFVTCLAVPTAGPTPGTIDRKRMSIIQEVYSADGKKLFASAVMSAALMAPHAYAESLETRYPSTPEEAAAQAAKNASGKRHKSVVVDVYKALSDAVKAESDQMLLNWVIESGKAVRESVQNRTDESSVIKDLNMTWLDHVNTSSVNYRAAVRNKTIDVRDGSH